MRRKTLMLLAAALLAGCTGERASDGGETVGAAPERAAPPVSNGGGGLARFDGYGDIPFGAAAKDMTRLWGGELKVLGKEFNDRCYFMTPVWTQRPTELSFMVSEGRFARFSTESRDPRAPGGARVGMTTADIRRLYEGRVEALPHHYTDGQYLRVKDPAGGKGVLVLETDGPGDAARVIAWRVGLAPEVDYVEGCA